jgi:hypothetical protein
MERLKFGSFLVTKSAAKRRFFGRNFGISFGIEIFSVGKKLCFFVESLSWSNFKEASLVGCDDFMNVRCEFPISLYTFSYRRRAGTEGCRS